MPHHRTQLIDSRPSPFFFTARSRAAARGLPLPSPPHSPAEALLSATGYCCCCGAQGPRNEGRRRDHGAPLQMPPQMLPNARSSCPSPHPESRRREPPILLAKLPTSTHAEDNMLWPSALGLGRLSRWSRLVEVPRDSTPGAWKKTENNKTAPQPPGKVLTRRLHRWPTNAPGR